MADIECIFCGRSTDEDTAAGDGWAFDFMMDADFDEDREPIDGEPCRPACEICAARHLDDFPHDPILKTSHEVYFAGGGLS
jgi:hypothetical protein